MPDITMCLNNTCGSRTSCYRYMAIPSELQSYDRFKRKDGECEHFLNMRQNVTKEQQEKLIEEIMRADEEDGLYEIPEDFKP